MVRAGRPSRAWIWRRSTPPIALTGMVGAAHDPGMMVALLLYTYARGQRSSRGIERGCIEDVAYRVIAANRVPDHCTIAGSVSVIRTRWPACSARCSGCARAPGWCTRRSSRSMGRRCTRTPPQHANRDYEQLAREILEEADEVDRLEDEQFGERRGDELPPELSTPQGRRGWLREAKRQLEEERAKEARPIPASRPARAREAKRRLEEELFTECPANAAYEAYRARGVMSDGRRFGAPPKPYTPPAGAGREGQPDRPRLQEREDAARVPAGLQRPGRRHHRSDRHRRGGQQRLIGLRAAASR